MPRPKFSSVSTGGGGCEETIEMEQRKCGEKSEFVNPGGKGILPCYHIQKCRSTKKIDRSKLIRQW